MNIIWLPTILTSGKNIKVTKMSQKDSKAVIRKCSYKYTSWKVSKYGVFSDLYFPVFRLNTGKYGPEKLRIWTLSMQLLDVLKTSEVLQLQWKRILLKVLLGNFRKFLERLLLEILLNGRSWGFFYTLLVIKIDIPIWKVDTLVDSKNQ